MNTNYKTPFAYHEGTLIDYTQAEKGIDYTCECGGTVRLRGGEVISDHFYHVTESVCSNESVMHKAYKDVLLREKRIRLPYNINGKTELVFDTVELEKRVGKFQPDVIGYVNGVQYFIEVVFTNPVDLLKKKKIKKANVFCMEIYADKDLRTLKSIRDHIVDDSYNRRVIHIPEYDEMESLLRENDRLISLVVSQTKEISKLKKRIKSIDKPMRLFYKCTTRNGAAMYKLYEDDKTILAFADMRKLDIKFES